MTYLNNFIPGFFLAVRVGDANGDARVPASGSAFTRMDTALTTGRANLKTAFICLFLVGAALRLIDVWRPVDRASWRECDEASIARNYYREDMNVLHPRVDWRGDGPGYVEMEFPLHPWLIAVAYRVFGVHDFIGRIISAGFSLIALYAFIQLARFLLPAVSALSASMFFVLNPLAIKLARALQPDGLMFAFYVVAAYAFIRWLESDSWKYYATACVAICFAVLVKLTAVHIGILFLVLAFQRRGFSILRDTRMWMFAAVAMLPSLAWYTHAHSYWLTYGNSLGVSNEYHWAGLDFFTDRSFLLGILKAELVYVWMPVGLVIAAIGAFRERKSPVILLSALWLAAIFLYYFAAARTTSEAWAVYYHVVAVPPAALFVGVGAQAIQRAWSRSRVPAVLILISGILASAIPVLRAAFDLSAARLLGIDLRPIIAIVVALAAIALVAFIFVNRKSSRLASLRSLSPLTAITAMAVLLLLPLSYVSESRLIYYGLGAEESFSCAKQFAQFVPEGSLILASGGRAKDAKGYPTAYNSSYMFYWMDRKGFNISAEEQSMKSVEIFAARGALYFVAAKGRLEERPGFEEELKSNYRVLRACEGFILFDLNRQHSSMSEPGDSGAPKNPTALRSVGEEHERNEAENSRGNGV